MLIRGPVVTTQAAAPHQPKQQRVLSMIKEYIKAYGYPPTRFDISYYFGWKSLSAAQCHLDALVKKKAVQLDKHVSRGIRIL